MYPSPIEGSGYPRGREGEGGITQDKEFSKSKKFDLQGGMILSGG